MKAKEFIPQSKPRNFVAKNQKTAGAGAHKDKKRAEKQGDVKHKGKQYDEGRLGVAGRSPSSEEKKKQDDYRNSPGMKKFMFQGLTIEFTPDELKIYRGGDLIYSKSGNFKDPTKLQVNSAKVIASKLVDKIKQQDMSERIRDPEDWDEGNTEPPNNMAVYINGKLWKVFQGNGYYADDEREMRQYYKLQDWARKKSEQTGKKWEVSRTGEKATESIKEDTNIPFNQCPHCSGPIFHESIMNEKQDACYHKVRSRYKVWPSAYASGALVQCRKKGAKNWGNKGKK